MTLLLLFVRITAREAAAIENFAEERVFHEKIDSQDEDVYVNCAHLEVDPGTSQVKTFALVHIASVVSGRLELLLESAHVEDGTVIDIVVSQDTKQTQQVLSGEAWLVDFDDGANQLQNEARQMHTDVLYETQIQLVSRQLFRPILW